MSKVKDCFEIIKYFYEKVTRYRKNIAIESLIPYDDRLFESPSEEFEWQSKNMYSNLIKNKLSIQNRSEEKQVVTSVVLTNVTFEKEYIDYIQYDGGFRNDDQKYVFFLINNGNLKGESQEYTIKFYAQGSYEHEKELLFQSDIPETSIDSGEIKVAEAINCEREFNNYFHEHIEKTRLVIEVSCYRKVIYTDSIDYIRDSNKFIKPLGGAEKPFDSDNIIFRIDKDFSFRKRITQKCNKELNLGNNSLEFFILSDESGKLTYSYELYSGKYVLKNETTDKEIRLNIFVPQYKTIISTFYGKFYYSLLKEKLNPQDTFSKDVIKSISSDIVYEKYEDINQITW